MNHTLLYLLPEIYLVTSAFFVLLSEATHTREPIRLVRETAGIALLGALVQVVLSYLLGPERYLSGTLINDAQVLFFKICLYVFSIFHLFLHPISIEISVEEKSESIVFHLFQTAITSLLISSSNLLHGAILILVLCWMNAYRNGLSIYSNRRLKYFFEQQKGIVISWVLLFLGALVIYFSAKSFDIFEVRKWVLDQPSGISIELFLFQALWISGMIAMGLLFPGFSYLKSESSQGASLIRLISTIGLSQLGVFVFFYRSLLAITFQVSDVQGFYLPTEQSRVNGILYFWMALSMGRLLISITRSLSSPIDLRRFFWEVVELRSLYLISSLFIYNDVGIVHFLTFLFFETLSLFCLAGVITLIEERVWKKNSGELKGLYSKSPLLAVATGLCFLSALGLPPVIFAALNRFNLISTLYSLNGLSVIIPLVICQFLLVNKYLSRVFHIFYRQEEDRGLAQESYFDRKDKGVLMVILLILLGSMIYYPAVVHWATRSFVPLFW